MKDLTLAAIRQQDAHALAAGYSRPMRALEVLSIVVFWSMLGLLVRRVVPYLHSYAGLVTLAVFAGYLLADFSSGFVHWIADTWGSTSMPLLGGFVRPFREHHVNQKAMTHHDYIETNGLNCMITLPTATCTLLLPLEIHGLVAPLLFLDVCIGSAMLWIMMTNQFHKWAHLEEQELPKFLRLLQRTGLILSPEHHQLHHQAPFATHYCITSGWLNGPLAKLNFFHTLERLITWLTGAVPRCDDIGIEAAAQSDAQASAGGTSSVRSLRSKLPQTTIEAFNSPPHTSSRAIPRPGPTPNTGPSTPASAPPADMAGLKTWSASGPASA